MWLRVSEWMRLAVGSQGFDSFQGVHACESFCEEEREWGGGSVVDAGSLEGCVPDGGVRGGLF